MNAMLTEKHRVEVHVYLI